MMASSSSSAHIPPPTGVAEFVRAAEELRSRGAPFSARAASFRESLARAPMSYKLWRLFLADAADQVRALSPAARERLELAALFEEALVHLHKMPALWCAYLEDAMLPTARLTETRRVFDRALQALPVTQHARVWALYVRFALDCGVPELYARLCRRFLMFSPASREEHVQHLLDRQLWDEAVAQLALLLDPQGFASEGAGEKTSLPCAL